MNRKIKELLNNQINKELESAYLYLEFSNFFDSKNLDGYANYYKQQAKEEINHAMRIYEYLHNAKENVKLMIIHAPQVNSKNIEEILEEGLKAEKSITESINNIFSTAIKTSDYASKVFVKWFVDEQFEEETNAQKMIDEYKLFKNNLYELNQKYSERKCEIA